jgi:hypothetical protein
MSDQVNAIRAVRIAAHELANACAAVVGGTDMALSIETTDTIAAPIEGLAVSKRIRRRLRRN